MDNQVNHLKNINKYLKKFNISKYKPYYSSIFYIATYANTIGKITFDKINQLNNFNFASRCLIYVKEILYGLKYSNYKIYHQHKTGNYDKIILTWGIEESFNKKGEFKDRYFNISSNQISNVLWFIIFLGKRVPKNLKKNLILLKPLNSDGINLISFFKFLIKDIKYIFINFFYYLNIKSSYVFISHILNKEMTIYLKKDVKKLIMPFEGQPFQNNIIRFLKNKNSKIKTFGYVHSPPLPMPSNFIFKKFSPDKILLNGVDQSHCFSKYLGWKKKKIKVIPSFRFSKSNQQKLKNKIFLPLSIDNVDKVYEDIEYLSDKGIINIKKFLIQESPIIKRK